jgi:hypothetical protein
MLPSLTIEIPNSCTTIAEKCAANNFILSVVAAINCSGAGAIKKRNPNGKRTIRVISQPNRYRTSPIITMGSEKPDIDCISIKALRICKNNPALKMTIPSLEELI